MRELLTFSMLVSLGGCESQVKGHIAGNANVGNDKATLLAVVTQLLPYIEMCIRDRVWGGSDW